MGGLVKGFLMGIIVVMALVVGCGDTGEGASSTVVPIQPTSDPESVSKTLASVRQPALMVAPNIYKGYEGVKPSGETIQFKGLPLYAVSGPNESIHLHLAAVIGGDVVCVFPVSQMVTIAQLAAAQPKTFVNMEGVVKGWEGADLIVDNCTIIS